MSPNKHILSILLLILLLTPLITNVYGWSNGGFSGSQNNIKYGTHDWIAEHALDELPTNETQWIRDNIAAYLYGTELPDKSQTSGGIGDTTLHHVYFRRDGSLQDNSSAARAYEEYYYTLFYLRMNNTADAAKHAGEMTHYISDVASYGHVMGAPTDWGTEYHHSDYEDYVNNHTDNYNATFNSYLSLAGTLNKISAYDATLNLAYDTTFDNGGTYTCRWMDQHYNWTDLAFKNRAGESLNLAVNYVADVLHTLYLNWGNTTTISLQLSQKTITQGESVTISGAINPPRPGTTVTISYGDAYSMSTLTNVTASQSGNYTYNWTPATSGTYQIHASWSGDEQYSGATSQDQAITIAPSNPILLIIAIVAISGFAALVIFLIRSVSGNKQPSSKRGNRGTKKRRTLDRNTL